MEKESVKTDQKAKDLDKMVKALREEVHSDRTLNAICNVFALRERARDRVTIGSLRQTMYKEGFSFTTQELEKALKIMANIGLGKLHYDRSGKVHALKEIKMTLQSIGLAAKNNQDGLTPYSKQKKFENLPTIMPTKKTKHQVEATETDDIREVVTVTPSEERRRPHATASEQDRQSALYTAVLSVTIEGKVVNFPLPPITPQELGEILSQGYQKL